MLTAIAAMGKNRVIGNNNQLPWHVPEDLKFFRDQTRGKILIMGRKTFESLGKPLPGRLHIVISRSAQTDQPLVRWVKTLEEARQLAIASIAKDKWPEEVVLAGGGEIYAQGLPVCDRLLLTVIDQSPQGDSYFPEFSPQIWRLHSERISEGCTFQDYRKA